MENHRTYPESKYRKLTNTHVTIDRRLIPEEEYERFALQPKRFGNDFGSDWMLYTITCEEHGGKCEVFTLRDADHASVYPYAWCMDCHENFYGTPKRKARSNGRKVDMANAGTCDRVIGCGTHRQLTSMFGHVDAPRSEWVRLCKDCQTPGGPARQRLDKRLEAYVDASKAVWKGMSKKRRQTIMHRMAIAAHPDRKKKYVPEDEHDV